MRTLNAGMRAGSPAWTTAWRHGLPIVVQAAGAVFGFLVTVLVAHRFGIEAQGRFGLLKGWADAISVALMFGLPQALLHLSYHGDAPLGQLRGYAQRYGIRLALAVLPLAALAACGPWSWIAWALLAAPGLVLHGLLRSLLLRAAGPLRYAMITSAPAALLFVAVCTLAVSHTEAWGAGLFVCSLLSAAIAMRLAQRTGMRSECAATLPAIGKVNRQAFVQNVCAAAQTALLLSLIALIDPLPVAIGQTSASLLFAQMFALVASFAAPMVYDSVANASGALRVPGAWRGVLRLGGTVLVVLILLAVFAVPKVLPHIFPGVLAPAALVCQVMAMAGVLMIATRLAAAVLQAQGRFRELTFQAVVRLALSLGLTALLASMWGLDAALAAAIAQLASEALLAIRLVFVLRGGLTHGLSP